MLVIFTDHGVLKVTWLVRSYASNLYRVHMRVKKTECGSKHVTADGAPGKPVTIYRILVQYINM